MNNTDGKTTSKTDKMKELNSLLSQGTDDDIRQWYAHVADVAHDDLMLFEDEIVICDTEATGPNPSISSLIQIAAVKMRGKENLAEFQTFVDPGISIPEEITELTGISNEDVVGAPDPSLAVEQFANFVGDCDLVAHNAAFDKEIVMKQDNAGNIGGNWIDTLALSRIVFPHFKAHRLRDLAKAFSLHKPTHSAIDDVEALASLWRILIAAIHNLPAGMAAAISEISPQIDWNLRKFFQQAQSSKKYDFDLRRIRRERVKLSLPKETDSALPSFPTDEEIKQAFTKSGLAGKMYPAYEQRDEQVEMALEITHALRDGTCRVIEAGTGVGKSMAYLLPAALVSMKNDVTIGIATKTNALLDQLIYNELPRLSKACGGLNYVALKGYNHYPCLRKISNFVRSESELDVEVIELLAMLISYVSRINWGDFDALNIYWPRLPRYAVEANSDDCLKNKCPFSATCFVRGARTQAQRSNIVVTNHSLLFRDAEAKASDFGKGLLPVIQNWIVDEAHAAEAEARSQFSEGIGAVDLQVQINQLSNFRSGIIKAIQKKLASIEGGSMLYSTLADIESQCVNVQTLSETFFALVKDLHVLANSNNNYDWVTLWLSEQTRKENEFCLLQEPGRELLNALSEIITRLRNLVSMCEQFEELAIQRASLTGVLSALQGMAHALELILSGDDKSYVYSAEINKHSNKAIEKLSAQKIDIGTKLSYMFYPVMNSVIFTSATLATGDKKDPFKYFKHSVGLDYLQKEEKLEELQLHSSYDFDHNMKIILPTDMPQPNEPDYFDSLEDMLFKVHTAMGGSVLTLFTNRAHMEKMYKALKPRLAECGLELRAQIRGTNIKYLRDSFIENKELSIFALRSFWEGFDAPGETLRCVVITKIPFGRPDEPLSCERSEREGSESWRKYSLPEAVMDLKQAAGRLIRSENDSGYLILADARLTTKSYGKIFLNAMPSNNEIRIPIDEIANLINSQS